MTMSVTKLLSRIVAPKISGKMTSEEKLASKLHDHTYGKPDFLCLEWKLVCELPTFHCRAGITSDPLTQFAIVLSALIHDVGKDFFTSRERALSLVNSNLSDSK